MRKYFYVELMDGQVDMILAERWYHAYGKMRIRFVDCASWIEGKQIVYNFIDYDESWIRCIYPWREYEPILRAEHLDAHVLKKARTYNDSCIQMPGWDTLRTNLGKVLDEYNKFEKVGR